MRARTKLGIVLGGYLLAPIAGCGAMAIYRLRFSPQDFQTMGGMIAGGEMMFGAAVFALVALVPTAFLLWFLRGMRRWWSALSFAAIAFAALGLAAAVVVFAARGRGPTRGVPIMFVELLGLVQMLGSPLWISAFGLFSLLAPAPELRQRMRIAAAIEIVVGLIALVHFFVHP